MRLTILATALCALMACEDVAGPGGVGSGTYDVAFTYDLFGSLRAEGVLIISNDNGDVTGTLSVTYFEGNQPPVYDPVRTVTGSISVDGDVAIYAYRGVHVAHVMDGTLDAGEIRGGHAIEYTPPPIIRHFTGTFTATRR